MRIAQQTRRRAAQTQQANARLIAAGMILQMPAEELQAHLEQEVSLNPALEVAWEPVCPDCGRELVDGKCWFCRTSRRSDHRADPPLDLHPQPSSSAGAAGTNGGEGDDGNYDPLENASAPLTLQEYVLDQARLALPSARFEIAEYLIAGLNDDGLLESDLEEAATALGVRRSRVEKVLTQLQTLDPPGVCARTVQESVLLQVRELSSNGGVPAHIEAILSSHWQDLAHHSYGKIATALRISVDEAEEAAEFIRRMLYPYPGRLYRPPHATQSGNGSQVARPDIIIRRELDRYVVEIVRPYDLELRVSDAYRRFCAGLRGKKATSAEQTQALEQYRAAAWLLRSLRFREETLCRIAEYTAEYQRAYLDTGLELKIRQLTRTQVAAETGKRLSTVARAVANKFVYLPNGEVVPFSKLLSPTLAPKTLIAELLADESPDKPLTDEKIARILRTQGFPVARRTIAKYRLALRLPSSTQRGRR